MQVTATLVAILEALCNIIQLWTFQLLYMMRYASEKLILTEAVAEVNIIFLVHITSCTPAEKAINVLLYDKHVLQYINGQPICVLAVYGEALFLS